MENEEISVDLTEDTLAQDLGSESGDGEESAASEGISLEVLNKTLKKDFKDIETALEALASTQSFVGAKKDKVVEELKKGGEVYTKSEIDDILFYQANSDMNEYREIIDSVAKTKGITAKEASELPTVKNIIEAASKATSSVMRSQARSAPANSVDKERQEALKSGNPDMIADWVTKNVLKKRA